MLYHYALMPDVFRPELLAKRPSTQVVLKQLLRGLCENGLVANLHADAWSRHVQVDLLPLLPPNVKDDVQSCLKRLADNHRLVTFPLCSAGNPHCHEDWLDAALDVHSQHELHGIVLTQALIQQYGLPHPAFVELSEVLDSPQWLERTHDITVSRSLPDYKAALTPLLKYAKTLDLIGPYMNCHEPRFFDMVQICARLLGKGRYRPELSRIISIHAGDPQKYSNEAPADRLLAWEQELRPLVNADPNLRFRVYLWSDYDKQERFHDRYILTDQCCVEVPGGLDRGKGTTSWSLKSETFHREQIAKFSRTSTVYTLLDKIEVSK